MISVLTLSSLSTLSYYGSKCFSYLFGAHHQHFFNYFYVFSVILGAVVSISAVINLVDGMYALMAILNMITALLLAPKVRVATKKYFGQLQEKKHQKVV